MGGKELDCEEEVIIWGSRANRTPFRFLIGATAMVSPGRAPQMRHSLSLTRAKAEPSSVNRSMIISWGDVFFLRIMGGNFISGVLQFLKLLLITTMRAHRFIGDYQLKGKGELSLHDPELLHQIRSVFRGKPGDPVILVSQKEGIEAICSIAALSPHEMRVTIENTSTNNNESKMYSIIYCAILKRENFETVVQKATEVGVSAIVPIKSTHVVKLNLNHDRLSKIAKEAAEQSGRVTIPELRTAMTLEEAFEDSKSCSMRLVMDTSGSHFKELKYPANLDSCAAFVGPEGGWTDEERAAFQGQGFLSVLLGNLTLRAETAAIITSYLLANELV